MWVGLAGALALATAAASAQTAIPAKPLAATPDTSPEAPAGDSDTWIFSGTLQDSSETFLRQRSSPASRTRSSS